MHFVIMLYFHTNFWVSLPHSAYLSFSVLFLHNIFII